MEKGYEDIYKDKPYLDIDMGGNDSKCWYIDMMYVPPNLRGNGEGKKLFEEFIKNDLDSDVNRLRLKSCALGAGCTLAFWESLGFKKAYYGNTDSDWADVENIMVLGVNNNPTPKPEKLTSRNNKDREMHECQADLDHISGKNEPGMNY